MRFSAGFTARVREHLAQTIEQQAANRLLHQQLTAQLRELDTTEDGLLNLAGDPTIGHDRLREKLREVKQHRARISERLNQTGEDLSDAARLIELCLRLLENPQALYLRGDEEQRRMLNQALFHALYVEEEKIRGHLLKEPFDRLHALQDAHTGANRTKDGASPRDDDGTPSGGGECAVWSSVDVLLDSLDLVKGSSKPSRVGARGLEPPTTRL
ncbi:hypothetical protein GCM10009800_04640 [Nocardiopsis rhodophaea]